MAEPEIQVLADPVAVAREAADRIAHIAADEIARKGRFSIALAGGSTPRSTYELLSVEPHRSRIDWKKVGVYFGDERTVPPDHSDSNYHMARQALLERVPLPPSSIHRMRGEIDPEPAAIEYGRMLKETFGADGGIDLVLLGMGDDGHTASLFPHTAALAETKHRCVANHVEKLNTWRLTLTAPFINLSMHVLVLVTGAGKTERVHEVLEGEIDPQRLPIQLIDPVPPGKITWLLDAAAAGMGAQ
jgi:6-phosphogluconolactonase